MFHLIKLDRNRAVTVIAAICITLDINLQHLEQFVSSSRQKSSQFKSRLKELLIPQIIVPYRNKIFQTNHGNYGRLSTLQTGSVSQEASSSEKQSHQERADGHRSGAVGHLHRIHRAADKVMESTKCETFDNLFICSEWYEKFKSECPNGFMTRKKGVSMYFLCEID